MSLADIRAFASRRRGSSGFLAGLLVAGAVAGGGVAVAAIPSSSTGQFTGCVTKTSGAVRIVDAQKGQRCTKKERTVTWSKGWTHRGAWAAATAYGAGSVVTDAGSSYVARRSSTGKPPAGNPTYWGLIASAGATGAAGATGPAGPAGPAGPTGPPGPVSLTYVWGPLETGGPWAQSYSTVECPAGLSVTGGGVYGYGGSEQAVNGSVPWDGGDADDIPDDAWAVWVNDTAATKSDYRVYAICAAVTSVAKGS